MNATNAMQFALQAERSNVTRHRRWLTIVFLLVSASVAACGERGDVARSSDPASPSERGTIVATVEQARPEDALRQYLHGWMLRYNQEALDGQESPSSVRWRPEQPDDFVSVNPSVSMTDFSTTAVWSATITPLTPVTDSQATYRADFGFWRGNPASSAGTGAVPLSSSATYRLSRDEGQNAWVIIQTSEAPDHGLVEDSSDRLE